MIDQIFFLKIIGITKSTATFSLSLSPLFHQQACRCSESVLMLYLWAIFEGLLGNISHSFEKVTKRGAILFPQTVIRPFFNLQTVETKILTCNTVEAVALQTVETLLGNLQAVKQTTNHALKVELFYSYSHVDPKTTRG